VVRSSGEDTDLVGVRHSHLAGEEDTDHFGDILGEESCRNREESVEGLGHIVQKAVLARIHAVAEVVPIDLVAGFPLAVVDNLLLVVGHNLAVVVRSLGEDIHPVADNLLVADLDCTDPVEGHNPVAESLKNCEHAVRSQELAKRTSWRRTPRLITAVGHTALNEISKIRIPKD
jgi:hypothetical protein